MKQWLLLAFFVLVPRIVVAYEYQEQTLAANQTVSEVVYRLTGSANAWRGQEVKVLHPVSDEEYAKTEEVMRRLPIGARVRVAYKLTGAGGNSMLVSVAAPAAPADSERFTVSPASVTRHNDAMSQIPAAPSPERNSDRGTRRMTPAADRKTSRPPLAYRSADNPSRWFGYLVLVIGFPAIVYCARQAVLDLNLSRPRYHQGGPPLLMVDIDALRQQPQEGELDLGFVDSRELPHKNDFSDLALLLRNDLARESVNSLPSFFDIENAI